jgi:hypothetical protein
MEIIQVKQNGDVLSCDLDISREEWLELMKDTNMPDEYRDALLRFYYMPEHKGTCTAVSNAKGGAPQSLNSYITKIGQFVQKKLNRFEIVRPNGKPCFWIIPMCEGMDLPKGCEGTFEWELRHELVDAIRDYLYWYLIERYKEVRKQKPIDGQEWTEIYKWHLITASKGKTPLDIVRDHVAHPNKSELGGFSNLIDAVRDNKTLKHLVDNNREGLQKALDVLVDETKPLNDRLADYKSAMALLLPSSGFNSKANDERTASTILTCLNPEKYTIYKYDVYTMFCKYLGEEKKPAGQCYEHFLSLLKPLSVLAASDKELQQIVEPSLKGQMQSDLLLAQDVLWILLIEFPEEMGYIHSLLTSPKQRLWLWSKAFLSDFQDTLEIGSSAKTIKDFTPYKSKNALRKAYQQDVGNGDLKIPDAYWSFINEVNVGDIVVAFEPKKGNGKQYHLLHGWGIITSDCTINESKDNPMSRTVQWRSFLKIPKQNEEMGNSVFFQGTTDKQALHIKELLDINSEVVMESKYEKYIDLLKANKNLILTGAPGTGKTFMAKAIAEAMNAEVGFVQFHPSYDYTDFVEGLRPKNEGNGNVGFERKDGVFKEFCKRLFKSSDIVEPKKKAIMSGSTLEALRLFKDDLRNKGGVDIKSFRSYTILKVVLNDKDNIAVAHIQNPWSVSDYRMMNYLEERICPPNDTYTKTIGDYILEHYYTNDSNDNLNIEHLKLSHPDIIPSEEIETFQSRKVKEEMTQKPFVFIIDEINRGEISKIFGELFFSIDPGYRGEKGKVNTQYQNMVEEGDVFKDGFYVPENVYIIGTMNDIDRSVESMDFAMRRRFAWQEVTAEESYANMIENDPEFALVKDEIKVRMFNLNKAIAEAEGLDEAYQIGAAYFRKYLDYQDKANPFDCLWENHLKGLLYEYLRGNRRAKDLLKKLHEAYNKTSINEQPAHTD